MQYFAYVRVSTVKQATQGVSLEEQRAAIQRFADRSGLEIVRWFEEHETAAKRGRPVFSEMLKLLRAGPVRGVIIHKIDRSARNLKDWADLGELIDIGIDVQFATESLDMRSRGGRLSADIQAVVAADYIRNLREETKKGFYGRLRQGLLPRPAPLGYCNVGPGQPKAIDPHTGPLVVRAFELYATGQYSILALTQQLFDQGLARSDGRPVGVNALAKTLRNPFYAGIIHVNKTGESFAGLHQPLVTADVFRRVQDRLDGKAVPRTQSHLFLFRRLVRCADCSRFLVGEAQKGHVYYRCHRCSSRHGTVREEILNDAARAGLAPLQLDPAERRYIDWRLAELEQKQHVALDAQRETMEARSRVIQDRLDRLTDAFVDGHLDQAAYNDRRESLLLERATLQSQNDHDGVALTKRLRDALELAGKAYVGYEMGTPEEKRDIVTSTCSNFLFARKSPDFRLLPVFHEIAQRPRAYCGSPPRGVVRTWDRLLARMSKAILTHPAWVSSLTVLRQDSAATGEVKTAS